MENDVTNAKTMTKEITKAPHVYTVLCVDDEAGVLNALKRLLKTKPYQVVVAQSAKEGLQLLKQKRIDIIISDMRMPEMSGADFFTEVANHYKDTFRILLTGYSDLDSTIAAVNEGQIHRYIQKPWNNHEMIQTIEESIVRLDLEHEKQQLLKKINKKNKTLFELNKGLEEKVQLRTRQIRKAMHKLEAANLKVKENHDATLKVFYNLISQNENLGGEPAIKVSELCELLAREMGLDDNTIKTLHLAGLLNELGMLGMPEELVTQSFDSLDVKQKKLFQSHPIKAYLALSPATSLIDVALFIKHQFEHFDGKGFPDGLTTDEIPLGSRILAIARDYIHTIYGKHLNERKSSTGAIDMLNMNGAGIYDENILKLLPEVVPELKHKALKSDERLIAIAQLKCGMELSRNIYNAKNILLLPKKHCFTLETIQRLKKYVHATGQSLKVHVFESIANT